MADDSLTVIQNDELCLSSADLNIINVPELEPFLIAEENVFENISSLEVDEIQTNLLDEMELHLECDDDRNYNMPGSTEEIIFQPTSLVANNVSLRISFSNNSCLRQETNRQNVFVCPICSESVKMETKFVRHMFNRHQVKNPFQCTFCTYKASSQKLLLKHVKRRHINKDKTENLPTFDTQNLMEKRNNSTDVHKLNRNGEQQQDKMTGDTSSANIHKHDENALFKCDKCDYTCKQHRSLLLHLKRHSNEFDFQCEICSKKFLFAGAFKRHLKTHQEGRPFVCQFLNCGKSFKILGALTDHERYVHVKLKKSECQQDELISQLDNDRYCKVKKIKKWPCTYDSCNKSFRDSFNLRIHMATHSGHKEHKCLYCDFESVQKASMNWHIKSKHNKSVN